MLPCANNEDLALAVGEFSILRGSCTNIYALAFGFLGGSEVQKAGVGNLGLQDREVSMFWRPMVSKTETMCHHRTRGTEMGPEAHLRVRGRPHQSHDVSSSLVQSIRTPEHVHASTDDRRYRPAGARARAAIPWRSRCSPTGATPNLSSVRAGWSRAR